VRQLLEIAESFHRRARILSGVVPRTDRIVPKVVSVEGITYLFDRLPFEQGRDPKLLVHQVLHERAHVPLCARRRHVPLVLPDLVNGLFIVLGRFEEEIADVVHAAGGLLYYDGANFNAILGRTSPGKMNFDIVHFNLHKTFTTPHGGGGPGAGPVGVRKALEPFLPVPQVHLNGRGYHLDYDRPKSIGKVRAWYGNFALLVRAYAYILRMGGNGLREVSERAVLNANYVRHRLSGVLDVPFGGLRKHEFVASASKLAPTS